MDADVAFVSPEETAGRAAPLRLPDGSQAGQLAVVSDPELGGPIWAGVWTCERREWSSPFDVDETFHVVSGHLRITAGGRVHELTPGATAVFPKGTDAHWEVVEPLKAFVVVA